MQRARRRDLVLMLACCVLLVFVVVLQRRAAAAVRSPPSYPVTTTVRRFNVTQSGNYHAPHFIAHRQDVAMTLVAVESAVDGGFEWRDVFVVDCSLQLEPEGDDQSEQAQLRSLLPDDVHLIDPLCPLHYAQCFEFVRRYATRALRVPFYTWQHADVRLNSTARQLLYDKIEEAEINSAQRAWGVVAASHHADLFAAFNCHALQRFVGAVDPFVPLYRSDLDYWRSIKKAGLRIYTNQAPLAVLEHLGGGSATLRRLKYLSAQERYGTWLFDFVGYYFYFPLKHGSNQEAAMDSIDFAHASSAWRWLEIAHTVIPWPLQYLGSLHALVYVIGTLAASVLVGGGSGRRTLATWFLVELASFLFIAYTATDFRHWGFDRYNY